MSSRYLGATIIVLLLCLQVRAAEPLSDLLESPTNDLAALVVQVPDMKGETLTVDDGVEKLDAFVWDSELPLLRKYPLPPGTYEVVPPSSDSTGATKLELGKGQTGFLRIEPDVEKQEYRIDTITWGPDWESAKDKVFAELKETGYTDISVADPITPKTGVIRFNTSRPWPLKPKPKPDPVPQE